MTIVDDTSRPQEPDKRCQTPAERNGGANCSMHNGVEVSCDCCSCEAEPYWLDGMRENSDEEKDAASPG